ncbi:hypothetical protein BKA57DRAFT_460391 [Linnemannia elongata]|nr:hypothetical protein BKA57DRAFT_460391 [Linnemannia elongata]
MREDVSLIYLLPLSLSFSPFLLLRTINRNFHLFEHPNLYTDIVQKSGVKRRDLLTQTDLCPPQTSTVLSHAPQTHVQA